MENDIRSCLNTLQNAKHKNQKCVSCSRTCACLRLVCAAGARGGRAHIEECFRAILRRVSNRWLAAEGQHKDIVKCVESPTSAFRLTADPCVHLRCAGVALTSGRRCSTPRRTSAPNCSPSRVRCLVQATRHCCFADYLSSRFFFSRARRPQREQDEPAEPRGGVRVRQSEVCVLLVSMLFALGG